MPQRPPQGIGIGDPWNYTGPVTSNTTISNVWTRLLCNSADGSFTVTIASALAVEQNMVSIVNIMSDNTVDVATEGDTNFGTSDTNFSTGQLSDSGVPSYVNLRLVNGFWMPVQSDEFGQVPF